jgi:tRNA pseudouridine55 synthase
MAFGVLNVFKPAGPTSRDMVNQIQRACPGKVKVGHAGTLDPMATGVLVIAVGPATKLIQYVQQLRKTYVGQFRLGLQSDTEDITGEVAEIAAAPIVSETELQNLLPNFVGTIQQTPPQFSAVKVGGQRAYKVARQGKTLVIKPRSVEIHSIRLLKFDYPNFEIEIECGKGTYIRTLGRDIAKALGSDTVMTALQRTAIGGFSIDSAVTLEQIQQDSVESIFVDAVSMVAGLPTTTLDTLEIERLRHGKRLCPIAWDLAESETEVAAINVTGKLLAVLERKSKTEFGSKINFVPQLH